ncbi:MAG: Sphingomyelinase C [Candidatus Anoxychlamydiales bacterium]|nr:Sphingomyelinase C [Candidatus Anoxychlamydiales bacterium]
MSTDVKDTSKSSNLAFYHRDYSKDCIDGESKVKRVCLAALPIISLYKPIGVFLSVSLGSLRAITSFQTSKISFDKGKYLLSCKKLFVTMLAVISVVNCYFKHSLALVFTNLSDVFENLWICLNLLAHAQISEALTSFVSVVNSSAYIAALMCPSIEIILLALSLQIAFELIHSIKEFKKDRYIEGASKLLMASFRSYQALPYLNLTYQIHSEKITNFITKRRENMARIFHKASAILASPFWWYSEKAVRIFSPIRLDKQDQCSTFIGEIATRAFYSLLALPMLPISLGLSLIEGSTRILANFIQPNSFFYLKGEIDEKTTLGKKLKILTMNVCFVSGGFPRLFAGVSSWKQRIDGIIGKILIEKPDVVCLQEVNDVNAANALYDGLKKEYAHFYFNIGSKTFSQNSGHFIASKYSVLDMSFIPFSTGVGLQNMVNKGLFFFSLKCKNKIFSKIFAVHLSPSKDDLNPTIEEIKRRKIELERVKKEIEISEKKEKESHKVLVGDMNLRYKSKEWEESIISSESFYNAYTQDNQNVDYSNATCATDDMISAYLDAKDSNWYKSPMILDYALLYRNKGQRLDNIITKLFKAFDSNEDPYDALSDHCGLIMTIPLKDKDRNKG